MAREVLLDVVRSTLKLQTSSTDVDLQESLKGLPVRHLKVLCREFQVRTSGTKAVLIGELVNFWKRSNVGESSAAHRRSISSSVDIEAVTGWTKDLSLLREFTFMHVYDYLIHSREKEFDRESLKAFKSLKAYKYFADGLVTNVFLAELQLESPPEQDHEEKVVAVKCSCFSSLKAKATYNVSLVMEKSGNVLAAKCSCVAGKGAACSHCAALMFYLEDAKRQGSASIPSDKTVTDQLQQWHVPSKRSIPPQPVKDIQFVKREYGKKVKSGTSSQKQTYDPRHTCDRTLDKEKMDTFVSSILAACPTSGIKHFWVGHENVEGTMQENPSSSPSLEPLVVYQSSKPSCLPDTVPDLADIDPDCTVFKELCHLYEEQQVLSEELSEQIEMLTVTQRQCSLWRDLHNGRITSSNFGQIVHRRETAISSSIVRQLMGYASAPSSLPQLQWGIENEPLALESYIQYMGHKITVKPSGLTLMPSHSYLGASADGIIAHADRPSNPGVLEIKCPFSVHGESVRTMTPLDIAKRYPAFYLNSDGCLKKEHNYYYQVQGEMAVKGCKWAHFTTWTNALWKR